MDRKLLVAAAIGAAMFLTTAAGAKHRITLSETPHHDNRGDQRFARDRGGNGVAAFGDYELKSSYDDRDWAPQSANDWWNDHPDRAYPRWVQEQRARGSCDPDRMWWSGSGWHC